MPVIRTTGEGEPLAPMRNHLVNLLVRELKGEKTHRGPVIFELSTKRPGVVDVYVVWGAWKDLPITDRNAIIRSAYQNYSRIVEDSIQAMEPEERPIPLPLPPTPATVIGATWEEVAAENLLPYSVQPQARAGEADPEDIRLLMFEAGAIETPTGPQLRFPDAQMAADVHARLMQEMPEAHWAVVETVGSIDDWSGN